MPRLLFAKTGNAVWISHLDLMRLFQRAFKRAGLHLKHTQGFNPRPSVSIALPLSVGVASQCELLDFELEGDCVACEEIQKRLNHALIAGVEVLDVYEAGRKIKELSLLRCAVIMTYDRPVLENAAEAILSLFASVSLLVEKKSKNGVAEQDIIPMIRELSVEKTDAHTLCMQACICCQNPSLNPMQLVAAIEKYLPEYRPDFARCMRLEIYDNQNVIFR